MSAESQRPQRYARQMAFAPFGAAGQAALARGTALIVGIGGLGSWSAELLARAGVGRLRLVDGGCVDDCDIHRQVLYNEADAAAARPKVEAAVEHLKKINSAVQVEGIYQRLDGLNIGSLARDAGVIIDGTDNFPTRFLINDYAVKVGVPWVFAGVLGAEAQTMTIVPGRTPCLRCVMDGPPPACSGDECCTSGVLAPAAACAGTVQAAEAIKILSGRIEQVSPYLLKFDLWNNALQRIDVRAACAGAKCRCCGEREFEFLEP